MSERTLKSEGRREKGLEVTRRIDFGETMPVIFKTLSDCIEENPGATMEGKLLLSDLNLKYIDTLADTQFAVSVRYLNLANNMIERLFGLDQFVRLEVLRLEENRVSSLEEVARLGRLPIRSINLTDNPVANEINYQANTISFLP